MTYHFSYLFKTNEITKSFFEIHFLIKFRSHVPLDFAGKHREKKRKEGKPENFLFFTSITVLLIVVMPCCCACCAPVVVFVP